MEEWFYEPFSVTINDGKIYGRGVSDNKGDFISRLKAVQAFLETEGKLPLNVKFVVEGEEEIGSIYLPEGIEKNKKLFSAATAIWEFGETDHHGRPKIYLGLKGVLSVELRAKGACRDVHSSNAPLIPNPAWCLVWALNTLKNEEDKILSDGFYDDIKKPSKEEIACIKEIPFEEEERKKDLDLKNFLNDLSGLDAVETFSADMFNKWSVGRLYCFRLQDNLAKQGFGQT